VNLKFRSSKELVEIGLMVLVAWTGGRRPDSADVEVLRNAFPSLTNLPIDDLACHVIGDLSAGAFRESVQDESDEEIMEVA